MTIIRIYIKMITITWIVFLFYTNSIVSQEKNYDNIVKITCIFKYQYKELGYIWDSKKIISTIINGTGFVVGDKIVTAKHVVYGVSLEDYQSIKGEDGNIVQFNKSVILEKLIESKVFIGGLGIEPERINISSKYDLAFLKISNEALEKLSLQKLTISNEPIYVGQKVEAWGFPSTSNPQVNIDLKITSIKDDWFVINQPLEPGFSGGLIIDQNNHVLGIISRSEAKQSRIIRANIMEMESDSFVHGYGMGTTIFPDRGKYVGEFKDGLFHGQGTMITSDGQKYIGEFKDDKRNGQGTLTYIDGHKYIGYKYVGGFKDDKFYGQGTYTFPDGRKYVGVGIFKDGKLTGHGTMTYPDGAEYVGEFKDDKFHGQGTYTWANREKYEGEFKDGNLHGKGIRTWPDGSKYIGEFKNGKFHGKATMIHADGTKYIGEFKDSKIHGHGTVTSLDGRKYEGEFKDNKRHGQGIMIYPDGTKKVGRWQNDEYIGD